MRSIIKAWNLQKAFATLLNTTNPAHTGTLESSGPITMIDDGLVYIELRPDLDWATTIATGKPTYIKRGAFSGFSFPLYAADEELFFTVCVPGRYDEASDIIMHTDVWLSAAEDTKNFNLQLGWKHYTPGEVVPATFNDVPVETATGATAPQFNSYRVSHTIDYDLDPAPIIADDIIGLRLRRIDASGNEIGGEVVATHAGVNFRRNKMGKVTP